MTRNQRIKAHAHEIFPGLGRTMTRALAVNGASKIFILGRREISLGETISECDGSCAVIPVQCDITSRQSLERAYQAIEAQTTHIDIFFANSGTMGPPMPSPTSNKDGPPPPLNDARNELFSIPTEQFTDVLNVNVTGTYYSVLAFLPLLQASNKRRSMPRIGSMSPPTAQVIITSSISAFLRQPTHSFAYNTSKAAVAHLATMLSASLAMYDIRVNSISPGLYNSEMSEPMLAAKAIQQGGISDGSFPRDIIPLSRGGSEEDLAGLIVWMASASGGYLNGANVITDGGWLGSATGGR